MLKMAVFVLADIESHGDMGRLVNALVAVKEAKDAGDTVALVFDGAGTRWPGVLIDPGHPVHPLYDAVRDQVTGACRFCADAFGVEEEVGRAGLSLLDQYDHHPSLRSYLADNYHVVTF